MLEIVAFIIGLVWLVFPFYVLSYLKEGNALRRETNELIRWQEKKRDEERLKEKLPKLPPIVLPAMPVTTQKKPDDSYRI